MQSLIIFASGAGSNADAIIQYFNKGRIARVALIVCNKPDAGVLQIAKREAIPYLLVTKETMQSPLILEQLSEYNPSLLVLAGFLWKVPDHIIAAYPNKIINIHPALLPAYGGKGMYGSNVHKAVLAAHDKDSGITVHYVNEVYDNGAILLQARCPVEKGDTAATLQHRVHILEHFYYPRVIAFLLAGRP